MPEEPTLRRERPAEAPSKTLLERIAPFKLWQVIVGPLIVAVVVAVLGLSGGGHTQVVVTNPASPKRPSGPPTTVLGQVERRPIWAATPQTFKSAESTFNRSGGYAVAELDELDGEPIVVTPSDLAQHGVDYEGRDVVLVGRAVEEFSVQQPTFETGDGIGDEIRLAGKNGTTAFIGSDTGTSDNNVRGEVVFAVGRVTAVGTVRITNGDVFQAGYFLASGSGGGVEEVSAVLGIMPYSIRSAARAARRQPLDG